MSKVKGVLTLTAVLMGASASAPAFAWHHGGVRFGVVVGAPFYPWYYPPYRPGRPPRGRLRRRLRHNAHPARDRMKALGASGVLGAVFLLVACASLPNGPSIMALPGTGKSSDQFRDDDWYCRNFANDKIGGTEPAEVSRSSTAKGAAIGAATGAGLGAAFSGGSGAGIGAAFGLLFGLAVGAGAGESSAHALQQRYDQAYVQCMYSKGHKVPVSGRLTSSPPVYVPPPPSPPPPR